ncbi:hypothetical protein [Desulfonatronospira sp.]|uniref:DUF6891 domain-containing protein n=1 Tax=Desulfonatronospira sp. TaxID=1962951 RepID=UPI0025C2F765|nr:hypothetical protein [Desulfonatronospira sp.]
MGKEKIQEMNSKETDGCMKEKVRQEAKDLLEDLALSCVEVDTKNLLLLDPSTRRYLIESYTNGGNQPSINAWCFAREICLRELGRFPATAEMEVFQKAYEEKYDVRMQRIKNGEQILSAEEAGDVCKGCEKEETKERINKAFAKLNSKGILSRMSIGTNLYEGYDVMIEEASNNDNRGICFYTSFDDAVWEYVRGVYIRCGAPSDDNTVLTNLTKIKDEVCEALTNEGLAPEFYNTFTPIWIPNVAVNHNNDSAN